MHEKSEQGYEVSSKQVTMEPKTIGKRCVTMEEIMDDETSGIADPPEDSEPIDNFSTSKAVVFDSGSARDDDHETNRVDVGSFGYKAVSMNELFFLVN